MGWHVRVLVMGLEQSDYSRHRTVLWTKPASGSLIGDAVGDVARTKPARMAESALLRQQLIVLTRQVKRPGHDRAIALE